MIQGTTKFQAAVTSDHKVAVKASVYNSFNWIQDLVVTTGFVTVSSTNANRRTCRVTLTDPTGLLSPASAQDLLSTANGNELYLWRGIDFQDGTTPELIPLGIFQISQTQVEDSGSGLTITVQGYDRSRFVQRAKFTDTFTLAAGIDVHTAILTIMGNQASQLQTNILNVSPFTIPTTTYEAGADPWAAIQKLVQSSGEQFGFDVYGMANVAPIPDIASAPIVWTYAEGPNAIILDLTSDWNNETVYNYFIVTGESTGNTVPVRAVSYDNNASSPTYYLGPYGTVVAPILTSPLITTTQQAQAAADGLVNLMMGELCGLRFSSIVHPGHDAFDCVYALRALSRVNNRYLIDTATIPLEAKQPMQCVSRRGGIV